MDRVFGAGNWDDLRYETVDAVALFSPGTEFVFMEGGDNNANRLESFIVLNRPLIESWVEGGGGLFVNAAPNTGDGMFYGFGVRLIYRGSPPAGCEAAHAVDPSHPIFNGPFTPVGTRWRGTSFCHGIVKSADAEQLILNAGDREALLAVHAGSGLALLGSMTTDNFQTPQPDASNLRANIIAFVASSVSGDSIEVQQALAMRDERPSIVGE